MMPTENGRPLLEPDTSVLQEHAPNSENEYEAVLTNVTEVLEAGSNDNDDPVIETKVWTPRRVTIEPVLILFGISASLQELTIKPLIYHKICATNFPQNICQNLHNETYLAEEKQVQSMVSYWLLYHQVVYYIPSFVLTFTLYGPISDKVSRRAAIALPTVGHFLQCVVFLMTSIFLESHVGYTLIGPIVSGLAGGWVSFFMAMFSYLGEASTPDVRTCRVSVAEGCGSVAAVVALAGGGVLLDRTSYVAVFSISCGLFALCPIYVYSYMLETPRIKHASPSNQDSNVCGRLWKSLLDSWMCVFRRRPDNGRARLLVSFMVVFTATSVLLQVYSAIGYLYLRRQPLSWSQTLFGIFSAVLEASSAFGFIVIIPLLKMCLNLRDTTLMIIGLLSSMVSVGYIGFCRTSWMVFIMPVLNLLNGGLWVIRSFVSQLVEPHEQGRMFAAFGTVQAASGTVAPIIFNTIYPKTLDTWAGLPFLLGTILACIPLAMLCWLHWDVGRTGGYARVIMEREITGSDSVPLVDAAGDDGED